MRGYCEEFIKRRLQQGFARGWEEGLNEGREEGRAEGREEGRLQVRAEMVLRLLTARGVHVDDASRQRILSCSDAALLYLWFDRAIHATSLSEVLAPASQ